MKKGNLRLIPLQADLCLNKQKVDIEDFKGWQDCNAPVYGDCLSPLYKKENEHHDIFIGEDKYDFENGVLYKNGTPVLSGAGSKKLVKTKINDNYSSMKITENNFLSWCKESGSDSVIVRLGETEETEITINNCSRIVSTKCFGDSQAGIYGCIVWYMHTSGSYGYYIVWDDDGTRYTSYGESSPTLFSSWEVVAPLIQVAIPSTNMVLISLFGNSGVNIPKTEVKNIAIYNNTVYDNPSFVDATSYPRRYNTIVERLGVGREHLLEDVPVAPGEDEVAVVHLLDVGAQQRFHVLFRIAGYLLELVDGEDAGLVRFLEVREDLFQRQFRSADVPYLEVDLRLPGDGVQAEGRGEGPDGPQEKLHGLCPYRTCRSCP